MGIEGFATRLRRAFRAFEDHLGRDVTQSELGELVGQALGEEPITQQSVGRWFNGTLPEHVRMVALADVLGVDPGWLSYGTGEGGGPIAMPGSPRTTAPIPVSPRPRGVAVNPPRERPAAGKSAAKRPRRGDRSAIAG
jgi:hypothetical protein